MTWNKSDTQRVNVHKYDVSECLRPKKTMSFTVYTDNLMQLYPILFAYKMIHPTSSTLYNITNDECMKVIDPSVDLRPHRPLRLRKYAAEASSQREFTVKGTRILLRDLFNPFHFGHCLYFCRWIRARTADHWIFCWSAANCNFQLLQLILLCLRPY